MLSNHGPGQKFPLWRSAGVPVSQGSNFNIKILAWPLVRGTLGIAIAMEMEMETETETAMEPSYQRLPKPLR